MILKVNSLQFYIFLKAHFSISNFKMGVRIRRFSKVVKTPKNPPPPEPPKKKTPYKHKFPAVTRIEKIMDAEKPYPQSTRNKIYFKSNDYGTGFQD